MTKKSDDSLTSKNLKAISNYLFLCKSRENLAELLANLLTDSEINKIHERIKILDCLSNGFSQRQTQKKVGTGIATISRGAQIVKSKNFASLEKILKQARVQNWWQELFWR